jgi:hypothetical protein
MALGDGSRKFGPSLLGLGGFDEQREAQRKFGEEQTYAKNQKFLMSAGRRAYRQASRSGNAIQALTIAQDLDKKGLTMKGIMPAGQRDEMLIDRGRRRGEIFSSMTEGGGQRANAPEWDEDGDGVPNSIQRPGAPAAGGPLTKRVDEMAGPRTPTSVEESPALDPLGSFTSDLSRSKLISSGDPAAQQRALERGLKLGLSEEEVGSIGGFDARGAAAYTDNPFAGQASVSPSEPARPANPLFEAAMARVSAAGKEAGQSPSSGTSMMDLANRIRTPAKSDEERKADLEGSVSSIMEKKEDEWRGLEANRVSALSSGFAASNDLLAKNLARNEEGYKIQQMRRNEYTNQELDHQAEITKLNNRSPLAKAVDALLRTGTNMGPYDHLATPQDPKSFDYDKFSKDPDSFGSVPSDESLAKSKEALDARFADLWSKSSVKKKDIPKRLDKLKRLNKNLDFGKL